MKKYKLGEISNIQISSVDKKSKDGEIPVKLCNFVDVYYNYAITKEMVANFMNATARQSEIDIFKLQKGQVALTKDSETRYDIGVPTYIADTFENVILGYHTALVTPNQEILNGKYLNAFLNTKYIQKYFENNATGSGQRYSLSNEVLTNIPIIAPDLPTQKKIGHLFSNIDKKIAINNQINELLERVARAIYEYYFVQFDFPNKQGQPYKSSGGAMSFDPTLNRPIPKDFEVILLKNRLAFERGEEYGISAYIEGKQDENCIKFYRVGDMDDSGNTYINEILHECPKVNIDDLLVSFDGSVGRIAYALNGTYSTGIRKIYDKKGILNSATLYFIFSDNFIQSTIKQYAVGTNILHAGSAIEYLAIPFDEKTYAIFQNHITPIFEKMKQTKLQNQKLKNLRDFLLPLLINAQVQI